MKKNILITGGAGFIGSHLVNKLYSEGDFDVTVFDSLSEQIHGPDGDSYTFQSIQGKCTFIKGDVKDEKAFTAALAGCDILIHLAAETGTGQSMYENSKYVKANCLSTSYIADFLASGESKITKVIVASSRSIYGEGKYSCSQHGIKYPNSREDDQMSEGRFECLCDECGQELNVLPTSEDSRIHPISTYGLTKFFQENLLETVCNASGVSFVGLRFQNVYGVGQSLSNPYTGIISIFSTRFRKGKGVNIFEDGLESRDFVYIDDVVNSLRKSIAYDKKKSLVVNVGNGKMTSVLQIANILKQRIDNTVKIEVTGVYRKGDIRHNYADLSKAKSELGFESTIDIDEGLGYFCDWMSSQEEAEDKYEQSLNELKEKDLLSK